MQFIYLFISAMYEFPFDHLLRRAYLWPFQGTHVAEWSKKAANRIRIKQGRREKKEQTEISLR